MVKFNEWLKVREATIKSITYRPGVIVPSAHFGGPEKMNPLQSVPPSRPYLPIFRVGNRKTTVANRKH
jgi:hypothetical protein